MANKIIIKRTNVQGRIPTTTDVDLGELAINTFDGRLFAKINNGSTSIVDLTENETVSLSGDASGSGRTSISVTLANTGVSAGTYGNVSAGVVNIPRITVDSKGRITAVEIDQFSAAANLGTIATQNANNVSITGGTIDGVVIGNTTRAAGNFTDVDTTGNVTIGGKLFSNDITASSVNVDGDAVITGNLTVQGVTTTVNSTTVAVGDLNIELAKDATTAAEANGGGLTVIGPTIPARFTYASVDDSWNVNKKLNGTEAEFTVGLTVANLTITGQTTLGNVTAGTVSAGQIVFGGSANELTGEADLTYNADTNTLSVVNISATGGVFSGVLRTSSTAAYTLGDYATGALRSAGDVSFSSNLQVQSEIRAAGSIYKAGNEVLSVVDTIDGGTY